MPPKLTCVLGAVGLLLAGCSNADAAAIKAATRISDTSFEAAARTACTTAKNIFDTVTTLPKGPTGQQSADLDETIARTFANMVAQIRQISVAPADAPAVTNWLNDWDSYIAFGHTYAAALRAGTERDLVRNQSKAQGQLRRRLQAFASANHMAVCKFQ